MDDDGVVLGPRREVIGGFGRGLWEGIGPRLDLMGLFCFFHVTGVDRKPCKEAWSMNMRRGLCFVGRVLVTAGFDWVGLTGGMMVGFTRGEAGEDLRFDNFDLILSLMSKQT